MKAIEQVDKIRDNLNSKILDGNPKWINRDPQVEGLIEFAYYHVTKALEQASKGNNGLLDRDQILNSYPLDNIK